MTLVSAAEATKATTNFNLGHNFFAIEARSMKLHTLVHHHKGYNLTKGHNSMILFDRIMPLNGLRKYGQTSVGIRARCYFSL